LSMTSLAEDRRGATTVRNIPLLHMQCASGYRK
jgi:hypothetical protein